MNAILTAFGRSGAPSFHEIHCNCIIVGLIKTRHSASQRENKVVQVICGLTGPAGAAIRRATWFGDGLSTFSASRLLKGHKRMGV